MPFQEMSFLQLRQQAERHCHLMLDAETLQLQRILPSLWPSVQTENVLQLPAVPHHGDLD